MNFYNSDALQWAKIVVLLSYFLTQKPKFAHYKTLNYISLKTLNISQVIVLSLFIDLLIDVQINQMYFVYNMSENSEKCNTHHHF